MVDYCKIFCTKLLNCCVTMLTVILCTGQRRFFVLCLLEQTKELKYLSAELLYIPLDQ